MSDDPNSSAVRGRDERQSVDLCRIVYTSVATRALDTAALKELCDVAARRNLANAITGLFLYDGTRFLQVIEGERAAVSATMARIARDPRHTDIVYILRSDVARREFPIWSMEDPSGMTPASFLAQVKADVIGVSDRQLRAQFIGFARMAASTWTGFHEAE